MFKVKIKLFKKKIPDTINLVGIIKNMWIQIKTFILTLNGSAFSQGIGAPHDAGLIRSGKDSGTHTKIKIMSSKAIAVAKATTTASL